MDTTTTTTEAEALRAQAYAEQTYPQYVGYWDSWVVATVGPKGIKHRGMTWAPGTRVLLNPASIGTDPESRYPNTVFCTVYLPGWANTSVRARDLVREG